MKKTILTISAVLGLAISSGFSQGQIAFANNGTTLVTTNSGTVSGSAALSTSSGIKLELFYQPDTAGSTAPAAISIANGVLTLGSWEGISSPLGTITPIAGRFNAGTAITSTDVAPAGNVWLEVVAWNNGAASISSALQGGSTYGGVSGVWSQGTGDGGSIAAPAIYASGYTGIVLTPIVTPEPSTIILGGLGAAALLAFRKRK